MNPRKACRRGGLVRLLALAAPGGGHTATATLTATAGNSLFADEGTHLNGAGPFLYVGAIASGSPRPALLGFDLSGIPAGATVTAVSVSATVKKAARLAGESDPGRLHRATVSRGEGAFATIGGTGAPAKPRGATWQFRAFRGPAACLLRLPWSTAGGDFVAAPSVQRNV